MCVFTAHLINSGKRSMLLLLCTKQCMGFSTCYDCSLSNSGCSLSCAFKAHLVSSGWISICCDCCFTKQWMWFSTCCQYSLSKKWVWLYVCFHSTLNKQWKAFHMLLLLCTKQCMGFSTCCHCSLSNISRCSFSCAVKAHLVSSGWFPISCHCCFTKQWMWFSTCCQCPSRKQWMVFHLVTVVN